MLIIISILLFVSVALLIILLIPSSIHIAPDHGTKSILYQIKPVLHVAAQINKKIDFFNYLPRIKRKLDASGFIIDLSPGEFLAICEITGITSALTSGLLLHLTLFKAVAIGICGFLFPIMWLDKKIKKRNHTIIRRLPDFLDVLTLTVEGGIDFGSAIRKVISITKDKTNPIIFEFNLMLNEMKLGKSRQQSLKNLTDRVDLPEMRSFISSLIQTDQLGTSLGRTLRMQADQLRIKRMQLAEKLGATASTKILIPLMIFIFPAMFIIVFGPIIIQHLH